MALQILSDLDVWRAVAYNVIPAIDGGQDMYECKADAYAYVVQGSMSIGMGELNEDTADEWLTRLRALECVYGGALVTGVDDDGKRVDIPVTMDALRPYFGTRTNVFPKESAARFATRMGKALMSQLSYRLGREKVEAMAVEEGITA